MDVLSWAFWAVVKLLGLVWTIVWFLLGGWVSTLAQVLVIVGVVYVLKYGWRRAPYEAWAKTSAFGRFFWAWVRAREPGSVPRTEVREVVRVVRARRFGDVNLSGLLNVVMLTGLAVVAMVGR